MGTSINKTESLYLKNNSGQTVTKGDVVIVDKRSAASFTVTGSVALSNSTIGVVLDQTTIADQASCLIGVAGFIPQINLVSGASLGDTFYLSSVAKQAQPHSTILPGDFGQVLGAGTTPAAVLWSSPTPNNGAISAVYSIFLTGAVVVNPDPTTDTTVDSMSLTFTLSKNTYVLLNAQVNKLGAHPDRYLFYDGSTSLTMGAGYVQDYTSGESIYQVCMIGIFWLGAGSHTITLKQEAALSTASVTFQSRTLIAQVLS